VQKPPFSAGFDPSSKSKAKSNSIDPYSTPSPREEQQQEESLPLEAPVWSPETSDFLKCSHLYPSVPLQCTSNQSLLNAPIPHSNNRHSQHLRNPDDPRAQAMDLLHPIL
jgi:hypothetical protein